MSMYRKNVNGNNLGFFGNLIFWGGLCLVLYLGVMQRFSYKSEYGDYLQVQGEVTKVEHFEDEDPESGNVTHSYDVDVVFRLDDKMYEVKSYNFMNGAIEPWEGMEVPVLYDGPNPKDAVVAKKDWLMKTMIPANDISDFWLFLGLLALGFVSIGLGITPERSWYRRFISFCGLLFVVTDGILCMTVMEGYSAFLPLFPVMIAFYFITKVISRRIRAAVTF